MELNIYSIHDSAASAFLPPFFLHNDGLAIRAFQDNVNAKEPNNISSHPEQFTLFKLGSFDDLTGSIVNISPTECIAQGINLVEPSTNDDISAKIDKLLQLMKPHINPTSLQEPAPIPHPRSAGDKYSSNRIANANGTTSPTHKSLDPNHPL